MHWFGMVKLGNYSNLRIENGKKYNTKYYKVE